MTPDLFWRLRARHSTVREALDRQRFPESVAENPAFVGRVCGHPTVPTSTGLFYSVNPVTVSGTEAESSPGALAVNSSVTVLVYVVGSKSPAAGEDLICRFVNDRWVAERLTTKKKSPTYSDCPCTDLPVTIRMTSSNSTATGGILQSSSLVYGPRLPWSAVLSVPSYVYTSTGTFTDQIHPNAPFYYVWLCYQGYYALARIYEQSPWGSPFRDMFRYIWVPNLTGNTCAPFLFTRGEIYPGGDPSCVVTLSE